MDELLVEIAAQPHQFVGIAQVGRGDDLVEVGGPGLVVELRRQVGHGAIGADGLHPFLALVAGLAVQIVELVLAHLLAVAVVAFGFRTLAARLDLAFALAGVLVLALLPFLLALLVLPLLVRAALVALLGHAGRPRRVRACSSIRIARPWNAL